MSDRAIQVGDLVQVIKPSDCGCTNSIGRIFCVGSIAAIRHVQCKHCGQDAHMETLGAWRQDRSGWCELYRLKRIPPLAELDAVSTDERVGA